MRLIHLRPRRSGPRSCLIMTFALLLAASAFDGCVEHPLETSEIDWPAEPVETGEDDAGTATSDSGAAAPIPRPWIWGVTIDDVSDLPAITASLGELARKVTARVIFDEYIPASSYVDATSAIHDVSFVMGELLDSSALPLYTPEQYEARAVEYAGALRDHVDIWEIGNEINGEWSCATNAEWCTEAQTAEVIEKVTRAFDQVKGRGLATALTLYFNEGCYSDSANEVFAWTSKNLPSRMLAGLDYVLLSYYEDDCNGLQPDWPVVFHKLADMFPSAKLGFGECGTGVLSRKAEYINRYYRMPLKEPRFIGGYFWWQFRQDMVPSTAPLWSVLNSAIAGQ